MQFKTMKFAPTGYSRLSLCQSPKTQHSSLFQKAINIVDRTLEEETRSYNNSYILCPAEKRVQDACVVVIDMITKQLSAPYFFFILNIF